MPLEFPDIGNPPNVIADAIPFRIRPIKPASGNILAKGYRFQHRTIAEAPTPNVVDFATAWRLKKMIERRDQIGTMDVVSNLLASIAKDRIRPSKRGALDQITQESVKLGS